MSINDYDMDLYQVVEDATEAGWLERETPAYGIAQQVIHLGYESLTSRQRSTYDKFVLPALQNSYGELLNIQRIVRT